MIIVMFYKNRGQTQVLSTVTFDSLDSMYRSEAVQGMMSPSITNFDKNFMLHYEVFKNYFLVIIFFSHHVVIICI